MIGEVHFQPDFSLAAFFKLVGKWSPSREWQSAWVEEAKTEGQGC